MIAFLTRSTPASSASAGAVLTVVRRFGDGERRLRYDGLSSSESEEYEETERDLERDLDGEGEYRSPRRADAPPPRKSRLKSCWNAPLKSCWNAPRRPSGAMRKSRLKSCAPRRGGWNRPTGMERLSVPKRPPSGGAGRPRMDPRPWKRGPGPSAKLGLGVSRPSLGVDAFGPDGGAFGVGATCAGVGGFGFGLFLRSISSLTAALTRTPRPSSTTVTRSLPVRPTRWPEQVRTTCMATSCALPGRPGRGPSNDSQQMPSCIPVLGSILESISLMRPWARKNLLIWSTVVSGLRPVIRMAVGGGGGFGPGEFSSH